VLFEGSERAVEAQLARARALVGGDEADDDVWQESRRRQGDARGRVRFEPGRLAEELAALSEAVVRPVAGVAYAPEPPSPGDTVSPGGSGADDPVARLVARLEAELDPEGVLG
jgi:hypothetical protein